MDHIGRGNQKRPASTMASEASDRVLQNSPPCSLLEVMGSSYHLLKLVRVEDEKPRLGIGKNSGCWENLRLVLKYLALKKDAQNLGPIYNLAVYPSDRKLSVL